MVYTYRYDDTNEHSYTAQYEKINENIELCNAIITLPNDNICCLIFAVLELSSNNKTIIIKNIQGINITDESDYIPIQFELFFKNNIVANKYEHNYKIIYENTDEHVIHNLMNKIIFKINNQNSINNIISDIIMNCLFNDTIIKCNYIKKNINYFLDNINQEDIVKQWFFEDTDSYFWKYFL
jgi:hypothetical protein